MYLIIHVNITTTKIPKYTQQIIHVLLEGIRHKGYIAW
jgi:phage antirepressor YoqD-like protein